MRSVADNWGAFKRLRLIYGYGSIPINTIFRGWTSIYQLFWCSPGVQGFDTLPYCFFRGEIRKSGGERRNFPRDDPPQDERLAFRGGFRLRGTCGPVDSDLSKIQIFLQSIFEFLSLHWYVKPFFDMFNVSILMFFSVKLNQESVICSCMFTFNMGWWTCKPPILGLPKYSRII